MMYELIYVVQAAHARRKSLWNGTIESYIFMCYFLLDLSGSDMLWVGATWSSGEDSFIWMHDNTLVDTTPSRWFGVITGGSDWCVAIMLQADQIGKFKSMHCANYKGYVCAT